jgi:hypothetical protein
MASTLIAMLSAKPRASSGVHLMSVDHEKPVVRRERQRKTSCWTEAKRLEDRKTGALRCIPRNARSHSV